MTNSYIDSANIQEAINEITCLFSLPEIYIRIQELMDNKNSNINDYVQIVSADPNLTASVLKIVNSAYFGFAKRIDNITRALVLIGIGQLYNLVLSISAVGSLKMANEIVELSLFWRRSLYCGVLSKLIAQEKKIKDFESLFVIGLLHEIGHLLLFFKFPTQSIKALNESAQSVRPLLEVEKEIFSVHYGQVGQRIMQAWNLPVKFQTITEFHPEPSNAQEYALETAIVHIAHYYAWTRVYGDDALQNLDPWAWDILNLSPDLINDALTEADLISVELEKRIIR